MSSSAVEQQAATGRELANPHQRPWRAKRTAAGDCQRCGRPLGDNPSDTMCRRCADEMNAQIEAMKAARVAAGNCEDCGKRRTKKGTGRHCPDCAKRHNAATRKWVEQQIAKDNCPSCPSEPSGRPSLLKVKRCPACLYADGEIEIEAYTFAGLIPVPSSGDKLEQCVRCEKCERTYHKGGSYSLPKYPPGFKLRAEHIGEDGIGVWFRPAPDGDSEQIEIEFEQCSLPDDKCTKRVPRGEALVYLAHLRTGRRKTGACPAHAHDRPRLREAEAARIRLQLETAAQAQSGGQKDGGAGKHGRGRKPGDVLLPRDGVRADFIEIVQYLHDVKKMKANKIKRPAILDEYNRRGEQIKGVSTITHRVHIGFGKDVEVEDAVEIALAEPRQKPKKPTI